MLVESKARRGVALMGICNVTPDSFSDGGRTFDFSSACAHIDSLVAAGADAIDIGGESTRPGAAPVAADEQIARIGDVVRYASTKTLVSVDTTDARVAAVCLDGGAAIVNDVSCMRDEHLAEVVASRNAVLIVSHARESQTAMRTFGEYRSDAYADIVADVLSELGAAVEKAIRAGVARESIVIDPGLGFSKTGAHSAELVRELPRFVRKWGGDVMVGASRKSFLQAIDQTAAPNERIGGSIAVAMIAARAGAAIVRVHDVQATRQALDAERFFTGSRPNV